MANRTLSAIHPHASGPRTPLGISPVASERVEQKRDLASWWKNFKKSDKKSEQPVIPQGIFGVPLQTSIRYANVAISLYDDDGHSYIYGYVPIVVAKCGVFLKEKATDVEGIFRLAGSEKRIKELKVAFDSPDRYGKGLDWTGYTVHDAANILRRYFNQLPEPIIPLDFYERFRQPLRNHQAQVAGSVESQNQGLGDLNHEAAISSYQALITELPPLNRQLLLYILDLLAVFASKSDLNKMTTPNLAAIFQPGILSHPQHDMAPDEYRLSQDVLIFLIENQDSFLIGMQGTEADAETVRDVQSGTPTKTSPTPNTPTRSKTVIARSGSNASAGAESVRRWGQIRRNVSVSSNHSQRSQAALSPGTAGLSNPGTPTAGGVYRSNTVPSRRTTASPRFPREKPSGSPTPTGSNSTATQVIIPDLVTGSSAQVTPTATSTQLVTAAASVSTEPSSEATTPQAVARVVPPTSLAEPILRREKTTQLNTRENPWESGIERSAGAVSPAPVHGGLLHIFNRSPASDGETRKPNKLQKRRVPGTTLSSAHSSSHSLGNEHEATSRATSNPVQPPDTIAETPTEAANPSMRSVGVPSTPRRGTIDATIRPTPSPTHSYHSQTDMSDADLAGDDITTQNTEQGDREKKRHRWRFSRSQNRQELPLIPASSNPLGMMNPREHTTSFSTVGSSQPRKSLQESSLVGVPDVDVAPQAMHPYNADAVFSDSERERKGPMSWIRGKLQERKDNKDSERRARTPERRTVDIRKFSDTDVGGKRLSEPPQRQLPHVDSVPAPVSIAAAASTPANGSFVQVVSQNDPTATAPTGPPVSAAADIASQEPAMVD